MIVIVDFGSQTTHLIKRRIEECRSSAFIIGPEHAREEIKRYQPAGIILSGGPASVYKKNTPTVDPLIFQYRIPLLGICYGLQLIARLLGGTVRKSKKKEFGPASLTVLHPSVLFANSMPKTFTVWMSHGDQVVDLPSGFVAIASTPTVSCAAAAHERKKIYGVQFHPEVVHTQFGTDLLRNFLSLTGASVRQQTMTGQATHRLISDIKDTVGKERAVCALSGGVDSSVAAVLSYRAIGDRLSAIYIDSGLMRAGETKALRAIFKKHYRMRVRVVDARRLFLQRLKEVSNPEKKRRIIGRAFISVLEREAQKINARFLVQGTIYPDVIESAGTKHAHKIKTHHNVGGLPKRMKFALVEPLKHLYKDEVRRLGLLIGLPDEIINRHPFPGPGLSIRIIGPVTHKKLQIVRCADLIIQDEITKAGIDKKIWQAFAIYAGIQTTGVRGDRRAYGATIALRVIEAKDTMSARWSAVPFHVLDAISTRIVNEIPQVNRVVYDITNKPPGTMEWE